MTRKSVQQFSEKIMLIQLHRAPADRPGLFVCQAFLETNAFSEKCLMVRLFPDHDFFILPLDWFARVPMF